MARIRTIKPEFWVDEKLSLLDILTRLVFVGLISHADDAGRLVDNVKLLDGQIFPNTDDTCRDALDVLAKVGRITRYTSASGQSLIQITNWDKHQRVDKPSRYVLPGPESAVMTQPVEDKGDAESSGNARENVASSTGESRAPILDLRPSTNDLGSPTREREQRAQDRFAKDLQEIRNAPRFRVLSAACSVDELGDVERFLLSRLPDRRRAWIAAIADDIETHVAVGIDLAAACRDALIADPPVSGPAGLRAFVAKSRSERMARAAAAPPARLPTPEQRAESDQRQAEREKTRNIAEARYYRERTLAAAQWEIGNPEEAKKIRLKFPLPATSSRHAREAMEENVRREIAGIIQFPALEKWLEESPTASATEARSADSSIASEAVG
jgi:hypothetical protein